MKKIGKFRRWLICKLGGIPKDTPVPKVEITMHNRQIHILKNSMFFDINDESCVKSALDIKRLMVSDMVDKMMPYAPLTVSNDVEAHKRIYSTKLYIIDPPMA